MSNEKLIVYGVLRSDKAKEVIRNASHEISSSLVVQRSVDVTTIVNAHGFVELRIELTDTPGTKVLTFIYDHDNREYGVQEEPGFQKEKKS